MTFRSCFLLPVTGIWALVVAFLFVPSLAQAGWAWSHPKPQGNFLYGVQFLNANTGFASGRNGTVIKTTDGGATWEVITVDSNNEVVPTLQQIHFLDALTGYAAGYTPVSTGQYGVVYKTTDGGASWDSLPTGTIRSLWSVHFVNSQTGYAGGAGSIYKTTDGGTTWVLNRSTYPVTYIYSIRFPVNADTGYAVGGYWGAAAVFKTTNGGATWDSLSQPATQELHSVEFSGNCQTGYIAGNNGNLFKTTDGGATWANISISSSYHCAEVCFSVDSQTGYAAGSTNTGQQGFIVKTTNGGATWTTQVPNFPYMFWSIHFPPGNAQTGYAVGHHGVVVKTTDGGSSWVNQTQLLTQQLSSSHRAVYFPTAQTGYVAGDYNPILKTTNSGDTWIGLNNSGISAPSFASLHFPSAQTGYIGGREVLSGRVILIKTTNGGSNWARLSPEPQIDIYAVCFPNEQTGYVGGNGMDGSNRVPMVRKTTDGGVSWVTQIYGSSIATIDAFSFPQNAQTGYAVGAGGFIMKTTDGGANWNGRSVGTAAGLSSVCFPVDAQTGFTVGWSSTAKTILKTTDGGTTWVPKLPANSGNHMFYMGTHFPANAQTGYVIGLGFDYYSLIMKTTDGGESWVESPALFDERLRDVYFPDSQTGFAVGYWGNIVRTTDGGASWVEEEKTKGRGQRLELRLKVIPNPFTSFASISGYENERFAVYDITGRKVAVHKGDRIGEGLPAGVYFLGLDGAASKPVRIVKVR